MHLLVFGLLLALSGTALSSCGAGLAVLAIGLAVAKNEIIRARGIGKVAALTPVCFAIPLAVFGAEHFSSPQALLALVPSYVPVRLFWVYFVGLALIAASLSIATQRLVRWSGLLFALMMFLFVAMLHLPGAISSGGRIPWTIVIRELSFGGGGLVLAGIAMGGAAGRSGKRPIMVGRVLIAFTAIVFGIQHFLHPVALPGVPLLKEMPTWIPGRAFVDYVTGLLLIATGLCFLTGRQSRLAAILVGAWIVLLVVVIYGPVLIGALADPNPVVQVEGINYFADTLLFGGVILSVGSARSK